MSMLTRSRCLLLSVCAASIAMGAVVLHAQVASPIAENTFARGPNATAPPNLPASETIRKHVDEVNVVFTVTSSGGRFVSKLSLSDLEVLDNRYPPEKIS